MSYLEFCLFLLGLWGIWFALLWAAGCFADWRVRREHKARELPVMRGERSLVIPIRGMAEGPRKPLPRDTQGRFIPRPTHGLTSWMDHNEHR